MPKFQHAQHGVPQRSRSYGDRQGSDQRVDVLERGPGKRAGSAGRAVPGSAVPVAGRGLADSNVHGGARHLLLAERRQLLPRVVRAFVLGLGLADDAAVRRHHRIRPLGWCSGCNDVDYLTEFGMKMVEYYLSTCRRQRHGSFTVSSSWSWYSWVVVTTCTGAPEPLEYNFYESMERTILAKMAVDENEVNSYALLRGKNFMVTVAFQVLWYLMLNLKNPQKNLMSDFKMPAS
ncbi:hypothetical protein PPTG_03533 [Phytophthora nicotianae INRA-310]|uniref:Uncharacterized protein n=1 Tax=Phytophthora nicotianae (strain INRA-310) TaxID=761204 RepID=W2R559_PHYN3|nr:hypothetical protein PPTG_03533 [Phytophthora nicotianae INRA-310]ETN20547.1 hypothetical protein PPTG_03533 [Phytophthora nicotianae INRA-310]